MNLKFRLAFLYSLSVFIILLLSAFSIFLFNETFRKAEFVKRLVLEGTKSAQIFLSVSHPTFSIINELNRNAESSLPEEKIYIFDTAYHLLYSTHNFTPPTISLQLFRTAKKKQDCVFTDARGRECVLLHQHYKEKSIYVLALAFDTFGHRKSDNLKLLLSLSILGGLLLSGLLAFFYVRHIMSPLEELKEQIEKIDEKNMKERIKVGNKNSEVGQIATKFNAMLNRLEEAFDQRKSFLQHASHELRTPLAIMLSQTESALSKDLTGEDYRKILISLKEDQQNIINLTNSLLTLSRYERISPDKDWNIIRIDEVLYEAIDFAKEILPKSIVTLDFEVFPKNESELEFRGNRSLIKSAVQNIIKNGVEYSTDNKVEIIIRTEANKIILHFDSTGKPLTQEEQNKLFIPFFRGENSVNKIGHGLGLSIVQRIINVHNGTISYKNHKSSINRFTVGLISET